MPSAAEPLTAKARGQGWHRRVLGLAVPIILANLSTALLGAVDTAVVGHLPDPAAIGGVGVASVIFSFLFWSFGFLRMGTTGFAAQAFGGGDARELRLVLLRALLLGTVLGLTILLLRAPISLAAFSVLGASEAVEAQALAYFDLRIYAAPFTLVNYCLLGWLLGTRRAGVTLALQLLLNATNILLDLYFVFGLGLGIEGVALASLIAEALTACVGLTLVLRLGGAPGAFWKEAGVWREACRWEAISALLRVNFDIFLRTLSLIFAFATFTNQGAQLGDTPLAGNQILQQFQVVLALALDGFAHAAEILAGNAKGAGNRADFRRVVRVSGLWALGFALVFTLVFWGAGPSMIRAFTDHAEVRAAAMTYLPWMVLSPLVSVWSYLLDGIFIGATRSAALRNAMLLSLAVFLAACWLLVPWLGNHGLWLALTLFMLARAASLALYYPGLLRSIPPRPKAGT